MKGTKIHARLLDLGDVSPLRSQSTWYAVATAMGAEDDPVVLLLRPSSALVTLGDDSSEDLIDGTYCQQQGLPIFRRPTVGGASFLDPGQLCCYILVPKGRADELGLSTDRTSGFENLARVTISACQALGVEASMAPEGRIEAGGLGIGTIELTTLGETVCLGARLWLDVDRERLAQIEGEPPVAESPTNLVQLLSPGTGFPEVAEALMSALEAELGFELIPSMPAPPELDALLEWDDRLAVGARQLAGRTTDPQRISA